MWRLPPRVSAWSVVDLLHKPWLRVDELVQSPVHHELFDAVIGKIKGKSIIQPGFFRNGWGDIHVPDEFVRELHRYTTANEKFANLDVLSPDLLASSSMQLEKSLPVSLCDIAFNSTWNDGKSRLPPESRRTFAQVVIPGADVAETSSLTAGDVLESLSRLPVAIILAGTGEHGFVRRRHYFGYNLAKQGVASIILESPYYGKRKPKQQRASKLRHVSDLPSLGRATIDEALHLVRWLNSQPMERSAPIILCGNSMGGLHSALAATLSAFRVGVLSWLGPISAADVFTRVSLPQLLVIGKVSLLRALICLLDCRAFSPMLVSGKPFAVTVTARL